MFFLYFLKKLIEGSKIDRVLRSTCNLLAPYYYKSSKKIDLSKRVNFIFICYGGLGDCILTFPFLIKLSAKYQITIFIENSFKELSTLLKENIKVMVYSKKYLSIELKKFEALNSNFILIQQSPILEFILFHYYLKKPPTIGFIYAQNIINSEGIAIEQKTINSLNKILKYNKLLKLILSIENKRVNYLNNNAMKKSFLKIDSKFILPKKYYILSATKNSNWKMGFLDSTAYVNLIIKVSERTNLIPVIIGTNMDSLIIDQILEHVPKNIILENLTGMTSIKDLVPLIKNAKFVLANDNGIHHLSNFLNVRTLTLYNFSSFEVYNWPNKNSEYIFNPIFKCMPCVGLETGPFDNYPFKCPWNIRCKSTINGYDMIKKLEDLKWIN